MRAATCTLIAATLFTATPVMAGNFADVRIVNRMTGERLPVYHHDGKLYVAGNPGDRYSVQVTNKTGARIMTVVSVDGVNVVSGETAAPHQTGYVLNPWQSYDINGWRKNQNEIAAFYFTSLPDSYAARTGRPNNVGVIGVAVFREYVAPRPRPAPRPFEGSSAPGDLRSEKSAAANDSAPSDEAAARSVPPASLQADKSPIAPRAQLSERIGTGHGERESSHVIYTDFRRASPTANEILAIHYDSYANLVARGIVPGAPRFAEPHPFPGHQRFVPDPQS